MSQRKRATRGQHKKSSTQRKRASTEGNELKQYLSIIDDLQGKLFNPAKYSDISPADQDHLADIAEQGGFKEYEKSKLWAVAENPDWPDLLSEDTLQDLEDRIIHSFQDWADWIQDSAHSGRYPELIATLHPATQKFLPRIVPGYQSPERFISLQDLEVAYNPEAHSEFREPDFKQFREIEPGRFQKLARERRDHHLYLADLIQEQAPITKEPVWPTQWMQDHKGIRQNLNKKKSVIPILQYLTDHAFHRTSEITNRFGLYHHESGNEYSYLVTKVNKERIADQVGASPVTVKKIIGAFHRNGFIKKLANTYYAIGYWGPHRNRIFFLKESPENRDKLVHFSYG